ncbi:UPF0739 protein C1orf74 homolog [Electrophorus electricus]|uniref:Uncharacterized protein n=1 Tax=Electrophorus electricus TaxID=8005 RepID=A0AAY5F3F1_ELEEL|nr:UPF0739 protein C1orf74 homolog [Electrophorus electricus]
MVVSADIFISTAHKFLCRGSKKKRLPKSSCLDLAIQIIAVDLGLKPALLYDSNSASAEQLHQYVTSLFGIGLLTTELQIISISGSTFVVNSKFMKSHLEELQSRNLISVDVCPWREQPCITVMGSSNENMLKDILEFFMDKENECSSVIVLGEELYGNWNLCTLFGILLGYPASYWFDQAQSLENCLSMTPLVVNKAWVCLQIGDRRHCSCLYSFSFPEVLSAEMHTFIEQWTGLLRDRFSKQAVFSELSFSKETVVLPCVTL